MIARALARPRKGDRCHHCNHSKKEHTSKQITEIEGREVVTGVTLCNHLKKGVRKDCNYDHDDFCECEVYL